MADVVSYFHINVNKSLIRLVVTVRRVGSYALLGWLIDHRSVRVNEVNNGYYGSYIEEILWDFVNNVDMPIKGLYSKIV